MSVTQLVETKRVSFYQFWLSPEGKAYREFTPTTAIYPQVMVGDVDTSWVYLVLGLIEELHELQDVHIQANVRSSRWDEVVDAVIAEAGDCLWYMSQLVQLLHIEEAARLTQTIVTTQDHLDLRKITRQLAGLSKKTIRDARGDISDRRMQMFELLQHAFYFVQSTCTVSLHEAAARNKQKLLDRQARNALGGSGDKR